MKTYFLPILLSVIICYNCTSPSEKEDKIAIKSVLIKQQESWSSYDLEGFMQTYWQNDSLKFYGANGLTYGWQKTLDGYKKRYPTAEHTGKLDFTIDDITKIEENAYFVMGQYHLSRTIGNANGVFMIVFRKINGEWKIVADMSC